MILTAVPTILVAVSQLYIFRLTVIIQPMLTLVAPCAIGAEKILVNELKQLGFKPFGTQAGRVEFSAGRDDLPFDAMENLVEAYRANLCLRTADRIYLRLAHFPCFDFDALFEGVRAVEWEHWFRKDIRVVIDKVRTHGSRLTSEHSIQSVVHKAVYDRLCGLWKLHTMPETGESVQVRVYIEKNVASILLDLSGQPLHRRGYRTAGGEAPIRETLAAVMLQMMVWRRKTPLHDPFCGSGTIAIEAALYAHDIAPGLGRSFALEKLEPFTGSDALDAMAACRARAAAAVRTDCLVRVTGTDIDENVLIHARANAERACVIAGRALKEIGRNDPIARPDFAAADFTELSPPYDSGLILSNPPYGERLGDADSAAALYQRFVVLFERFNKWDMGFITSHQGFEQACGRRAASRRTLKSGNLDTSLYIFGKEAP